mmetsp:Transcript_33952/g.81460  ORF Transcript_33952/g.81460 Transcript_33952/m.81460 type:complete len:242 (+) Transcript_33952:593-1318(+)
MLRVHLLALVPDVHKLLQVLRQQINLRNLLSIRICFSRHILSHLSFSSGLCHICLLHAPCLLQPCFLLSLGRLGDAELRLLPALLVQQQIDGVALRAGERLEVLRGAQPRVQQTFGDLQRLLPRQPRPTHRLQRQLRHQALGPGQREGAGDGGALSAPGVEDDVVPENRHHRAVAGQVLLSGAGQTVLELLVLENDLQHILGTGMSAHQAEGGFDSEVLDVRVRLLVVCTAENAELGKLLW